MNVTWEDTGAENGGGGGKRSFELAVTRRAFVACTISLFVSWLGSGDRLLMTIAMNEVMTVRNRAIYAV